MVTHNGIVDIGGAFSVGEKHDLLFTYTDAVGNFFAGNVVYSEVPEPGSAVLLGLGAIGVVLAAFRRRSLG